MMPVIPHFSSESISLLKVNENVEWPIINIKGLIKENTKYVVQINGKTRQIIENKNDLTEEELINLVEKDKKLIKYFQKNLKIKKTIFIPNKIINIII
jgi:leucyl-tRNA synthetase